MHGHVMFADLGEAVVSVLAPCNTNSYETFVLECECGYEDGQPKRFETVHETVQEIRRVLHALGAI